MKKIISITAIIVCACIIAACVVYDGFSLRTSFRNIIKGKYSWCEEYGIYQTIVDDRKGQVLSFIFEYCTGPYNEQNVNGNETASYSNGGLGRYIEKCKVITEITKINEIVYISYYANDGNQVILAYTNEGLMRVTVMNKKETAMATYKPISGEYDLMKLK